MVSDKDRRRYTRIDFGSTAKMIQGANAIEVHLIDISLNGVLIETPADYELNTAEPVDICITLTGDCAIQMKTRIAHSSSQVLGFHCESIDMDSMTHLRRLIELNIEAPNASERVLEELITPR